MVGRVHCRSALGRLVGARARFARQKRFKLGGRFESGLTIRGKPTRWPLAITSSQHVYGVRPRKDKRGVDLSSDALPFGRLWYEQAPEAISKDCTTRLR